MALRGFEVLAFYLCWLFFWRFGFVHFGDGGEFLALALLGSSCSIL